MRREYENLRSSGAEILGVSTDPQETNDRFRESLKLPFLLVGDPKGKIARAYKVRWPLIGVAQRVTYVIGPDRKIRMSFHTEFDMDAHVSRACQELGAAGS